MEAEDTVSPILCFDQGPTSLNDGRFRYSPFSRLVSRNTLENPSRSISLGSTCTLILLCHLHITWHDDEWSCDQTTLETAEGGEGRLFCRPDTMLRPGFRHSEH